MGLPAAKHLDVVMGIDTHIILIPSPAGPVPTPIPHPYIGILFDPMDYVPMMGATVKVNGVPRAVAGTSGQALPPHIPMGGPFAKPPTNESEMFMGSKTVHADGDPMSFAGLPVLSCQDIGMPAPPRPKKKSAAKSLMLPVSKVLPIPTGPMVLVGGPPTIQDIGVLDVIGPLAKGLGKARKALAKRSKKFARKMKSLSKKLHNAAGAVMDKLKINKKSVLRNKVHRGICAVTGHPVDITTGKLFTDFVDLEFQGPLPFKLERVFHHHAQWLVGVTDPAGGYTALGYDARGNLDAVATPDNAITRYAHDLLGRVTAVTDPRGNVQGRELDLLGRVTSVQEPDGNVRSLLYDREGNVLHAKDVQHDVRFTYAGMNQLASRSEAGTTVRFEYDTEEQLLGIINEHRHVYRFKLGPTGEVDEEHGFDGLMRRYTRDRASRVTRVERPGSRFSSFKYDPAGRVISVTHFDQSIERFAYRPDGELTHASNSEAALVFERDALGRILKESQGEHWVASEYDLLGLRARMRSSLGAGLELARNVMGDVTELREQQGFQARFERDVLGLELARSLPGSVKSRWERDKLGRPAQHTVSSERGTLRAVGYQWEPNDRLRKVIDALEGPTEYRHDALGNLAWGRYADGKGEMRMPDAVGNLFKREDRKDRVYGPAGQLLVQSTARGEIHYAYDPEGNLVEKREPGGRTWRYAWNGAGMLAEVTRPDGTEVTFGYDPLGRRVRKTYRGQTTRWVWDGNVPLHEWVEGALEPLPEPEVPYLWNADPLIKKREAELAELLNQGPPERGTKQSPITWVFETESFAPLAKLLSGRHCSIVTDHLGAPVLMADGQGEAVWSTQYSVYGELRSLTGARQACPFRWPGQYEDLETGLYYNRFRYYDSESGQFTSQDPIGLVGGMGPHAYVHDPLAWMDPLGLARQAGACGGGSGKELDPKSINFSQTSVNRRFDTSTGKISMDSAIRGGPEQVKEFPPMSLGYWIFFQWIRTFGRDWPNSTSRSTMDQHPFVAPLLLTSTAVPLRFGMSRLQPS